MNDYGINNYSEGDVVSCQYGNTDNRRRDLDDIGADFGVSE